MASPPFQMDAFEAFLRRAATRGLGIEAAVVTNGHGQIVLGLTQMRDGTEVERAKFIVRAHSAIEIGLKDVRGRAAARARD